MATIVNNPQPVQAPQPVYQERDSGTGFLLGVILLIVFAVLFFVYGLPYVRSTFSTPQVTVPDQIDVNVNTPNK